MLVAAEKQARCISNYGIRRERNLFRLESRSKLILSISNFFFNEVFVARFIMPSGFSTYLKIFSLPT